MDNMRYQKYFDWIGAQVVNANDLCKEFNISHASARHNLSQLVKLGLLDIFDMKNRAGFVCKHYSRSVAAGPPPPEVKQEETPAETVMSTSKKAYLDLCHDITGIKVELKKHMDDWYLPMCHINAWPFTNHYGDLYEEERLYGFKPSSA